MHLYVYIQHGSRVYNWLAHVDFNWLRLTCSHTNSPTASPKVWMAARGCQRGQGRCEGRGLSLSLSECIFYRETRRFLLNSFCQKSSRMGKPQLRFFASGTPQKVKFPFSRPCISLLVACFFFLFPLSILSLLLHLPTRAVATSNSSNFGKVSKKKLLGRKLGFMKNYVIYCIKLVLSASNDTVHT